MGCLTSIDVEEVDSLDRLDLVGDSADDGRVTAFTEIRYTLDQLRHRRLGSLRVGH